MIMQTNKMEQFISGAEFGELQGILQALFTVKITLLSVRKA